MVITTYNSRAHSHFLAIRIGMNKMAGSDGHLDDTVDTYS